jgi:hypothetical protein
LTTPDAAFFRSLGQNKLLVMADGEVRAGLLDVLQEPVDTEVAIGDQVDTGGNLQIRQKRAFLRVSVFPQDRLRHQAAGTLVQHQRLARQCGGAGLAQRLQPVVRAGQHVAIEDVGWDACQRLLAEEPQLLDEGLKLPGNLCHHRHS